MPVLCHHCPTCGQPIDDISGKNIRVVKARAEKEIINRIFLKIFKRINSDNKRYTDWDFSGALYVSLKYLDKSLKDPKIFRKVVSELERYGFEVVSEEEIGVQDYGEEVKRVYFVITRHPDR